MSRKTPPRDERHISTDRETVRSWADEYGAVPVEHDGWYDLVPESEAGTTGTRVEWNEFFDHVDEQDYVVIYQEEGAEPFEVATRDQALERTDTTDEELEERLIEGETVTTTVEETTVVETVVREEATVESELVDTELVDQQLLDAELLSRECTSCDLVEKGTNDNRKWFDEDHYLERIRSGDEESTGTGTGTRTLETTDDVPYAAELDVEEAWAVTRTITERFVVESRVVDTEVGETDTVESHDIDVEGLQRSIVENNVLDIHESPDEVMTQYEIESEFAEDDRVHTQFVRDRTVEDRVVDRKRVHADVTGGESLSMDIDETTVVMDETTDPADEMGTTTEGHTTGSHTTEGETVEGTREVVLSDGEVGKKVVNASGDEIGEVEDVSDDGERMEVDVKQGLAGQIRSALDWGDDQDTYTVNIDQVEHIYEDEVVLRRSKEL